MSNTSTPSSACAAPALDTSLGCLKTCTHCGQSKPEGEFGFKDKARGLRRAHCLACNRLKQKAHYQNNVSYYVEKAAVNKAPAKQRARALVAQSLAGQRCAVCEGSDKLTHYQGPGSTHQPVHMAVNAGLSEAQVLEAIGRSTIVCKPCLGDFMASGMAFWSKLNAQERRALQAQRAEAGVQKAAPGQYKRYRPVGSKASTGGSARHQAAQALPGEQGT